MKHDPIGGALVILFAAIAGFVLCEMLSVPSKPVLEASGEQERLLEARRTCCRGADARLEEMERRLDALEKRLP